MWPCEQVVSAPWRPTCSETTEGTADGSVCRDVVMEPVHVIVMRDVGTVVVLHDGMDVVARCDRVQMMWHAKIAQSLNL